MEDDNNYCHNGNLFMTFSFLNNYSLTIKPNCSCIRLWYFTNKVGV